MTYKITDSLTDEVNLLKEMAKVENSNGKVILAAILDQIAYSHERVINRINNGVDYSLGVSDGRIKIQVKKAYREL